MFYTYILISLKDHKHYIGHCDNLKDRFQRHQDGGVPATANRRPLRLVYYEACLNLKKTIARERYFKTGFGTRFLKDRI